jgi:apolipoprotein N-acyltransferase
MEASVMTKGVLPAADRKRHPSPALSSFPLLRSPLVVLLLAALSTGALLWSSHFPLAWGWLGWVALVPLLVLVRTPVTGWRVYLAAWVGGLTFFWPVLQWMRVADERMYYTWGTLATYCALYFPAAVFLLRRLDRATPLPLTLTLPVVWTALEFFRSSFMGGFATMLQGNPQHDYPGGFPWYFLAYTQQAVLPVIQVADLGGVYTVSFLVAMVNGLVFEALARRRWFQSFLCLPDHDQTALPMRIWVQALVVLLTLGTALAYGFWRLGQEDFATGPRLALLQGDLDQRLRNRASSAGEGSDEARRVIAQHYGELCFDAADRQPAPDLIVWPETSFPDEWSELEPGVRGEDLIPAVRKGIIEVPRLDAERVARASRTNLLIGTTVQFWDAGPSRPEGKTLRPVRRYNSALLIDAHGNEGPRYSKMHRVPFGEFVPLRETVPFLNRFAPYDFDYSVEPGPEFTQFPLGQYQFGVVICYEDTDPYLARQYVNPSRGRPADFMINISNDGWFNGTSEHEEHLAICRFRAVECRRAVARAVNMGISAIIDGNGRVIELPGPTWAESKKVATVVAGNIPIDRRTSLYARWGDWLPWSCWGLIAIGCITAVVRRRREH